MEETLNQIDVYQQNITSLRQRIIQEEQKLRVILSPAYLTQNKERAVTEEQVRVCCLTPSLALDHFHDFIETEFTCFMAVDHLVDRALENTFNTQCASSKLRLICSSVDTHGRW